LRYELEHLAAKLRRRNPEWIVAVARPEAHPMFEIVGGPVAAWERVKS